MTFSLQTPITTSITRYAKRAGKQCTRAGLKDAREIGFGTRNRDRIQEGAWLAPWRGRRGVVPSRTRRPLSARENGRRIACPLLFCSCACVYVSCVCAEYSTHIRIYCVWVSCPRRVCSKAILLTLRVSLRAGTLNLSRIGAMTSFARSELRIAKCVVVITVIRRSVVCFDGERSTRNWSI